MRWMAVVALSAAIPLMISAVSGVAVAQDHDQTVQSLLAEARVAQSREDFAQAAGDYRKAVSLEPAIPELWANLGLMQHEAGMSADAIQSFQRAIRLNPSLFGPQLFLGIEYLKSKDPASAIPFLEKAEKLNPNDLQAALSLGKAYALSNREDRAADAYLIATRLSPQNANTWLNLGTAYLQQVETDARLMTSVYRHSAYVSLRAAETLAEEGKPLQAENAYKAAIASASPPPCTHAEFGITLLRMKNVAAAREQFELETKSRSHCGLVPLGLALTQLVEGRSEEALTRLISISAADPGFVESSLPLFRDAVSADQAKSLVDLSRRGIRKPVTQSRLDHSSRRRSSPMSRQCKSSSAPWRSLQEHKPWRQPMPKSSMQPVSSTNAAMYSSRKFTRLPAANCSCLQPVLFMQGIIALLSPQRDA